MATYFVYGYTERESHALFQGFLLVVNEFELFVGELGAKLAELMDISSVDTFGNYCA